MLMTVEVRSNPRTVLAIPEIAIIDAADGSYVFRVARGDRGATAQRVPIHAGQRSGGVAEILGGLNPGDMVVTEGIQSVRPGQPVRVTGQGRSSNAEALELRPRG
jgi:membrane fusion protein (multidrug efflux system)